MIERNAHIRYLTHEIIKHRKLYEAGCPQLSDAEYDLLENELSKLDPHNEVIHRVGSAVKLAVKLPYPMPSLDKVRPDRGAQTWLATRQGVELIISHKLDGVSILLVYEQGQSVKAYTRGDGCEGGDISHLVPFLPSIPTTLSHERLGTDKLVLRGELIMPTATFHAHWETEYKNARNLVAGITNRKTIHDALKQGHCEVVIYDVLYPRMKPSCALSDMSQLGFKVVTHKRVSTLTVVQLQNLFKKAKEISVYEVDGIVISENTIQPVPENNPSYACAFKDLLEVDRAIVTVTGVVWQASRLGKLTPVVEFNPVRLEGVDVSRVTAHNAKVIYDGLINVGATIEVSRSGGVIPYLNRVVTPATCWAKPEGEWAWTDSGVDIMLASKTESVAIRAMTHFFEVLDIDGLRAGTLAKLHSAGLTNALAVITCDLSRFESVIGKNIHKIIKQFSEKLPHIEPVTLAVAWGEFGRAVGYERLTVLFDTLGWGGVKELATKDNQARTHVCQDLLGEITGSQVAINLPRFIQFADSFPFALQEESNPIAQLSQTLSGITVTFSGIRDASVEDFILQHGGKVANSVTKETTHLVCKDISSQSSKTVKARAQGCTILSLGDFKTNYGVI